MNPNSIVRRSAVALALLTGAALVSCGSDETGEQLPAVTDADDAAGEEPAPGSAGESTPPSEAGPVIGTGNVGGTVVDPRPHPIDGIDIAESSPEQLVVRFTSGDPNCTAADATAVSDGDRVVVSLLVGITEDALARSCLACDVEQSVTIALDEGLDGRDVVTA